MQWAALIAAAIKLFDSIVSWLHDRELLNAGKAQAQAAQKERDVQETRIAEAAREEIRGAAAGTPDIRMRDDPFCRD